MAFAGTDPLLPLAATNLVVTQGIDLGAGTTACSPARPGSSATSLSAKSFKVTGGAGADIIALVTSGALGNVSLDLGAGNNSASFAAIGGSALIAGAFTFTSAS